MKKISKYLILLISLTMILGLNSCNSDNFETEFPSYLEEKVPVTIGSKTFMLFVFDNATGRAFKALLPFTVSMEDVNSNEKIYRLPQDLPQSAVNPGTIRIGDLNLYGSNGLVLFYKTFQTSYSYTRIGTIDNPSLLESALGSGTVLITFGEVKEAQNPTLIYNINGATSGSAPDAITENKGTPIRLNNGSGLSRTGYTFNGWNTKADGTGTDYVGGSSYTLANNVTLYEKWNRVIENDKMRITVGSTSFMVTLASNQTATAFKTLLPITINMSDMNRNEKYYDLSQSLPTNVSNPEIIQNGDLMLYSSRTLVLFYKTFSTSYSYTRIGKVDDPSGLENALGAGSATVTFEII